MQSKIDFSGLERLTPRADSWEKVCARLDAEHSRSKAGYVAKRTVPFRLFKAIPLAAAFVFAAVGIFAIANINSSESVSLNNVVADEVSAWYNSLGVSAPDSAGVIDDFENLDESITLSYFYKE